MSNEPDASSIAGNPAIVPVPAFMALLTYVLQRERCCRLPQHLLADRGRQAS
jgi:hypothetical protein